MNNDIASANRSCPEAFLHRGIGLPGGREQQFIVVEFGAGAVIRQVPEKYRIGLERQDGLKGRGRTDQFIDGDSGAGNPVYTLWGVAIGNKRSQPAAGSGQLPEYFKTAIFISGKMSVFVLHNAKAAVITVPALEAVNGLLLPELLISEQL